MIPPISGKIAHSPAPTLEGSPVSLEAEVPDIELYRDGNRRIFGAIVKSVVRMSRFRARIRDWCSRDSAGTPPPPACATKLACFFRCRSRTLANFAWADRDFSLLWPFYVERRNRRSA